MRRTFLWVMVFLMLGGVVLSLGVTPAKVTIRHGVDDPTFSFRPIVHEPGKLAVRVEGNLAEYVTVQKQDGIITGSVALQDPPPGVHTQRVIIGSIPEEATGTIAGRTEIAALLIIKVPYPDEYLEADWFASTDGGTGNVFFTVTLENLGSDDVTPRSADITLADDVLELDTPNVQPASFAQLRTMYDGFQEKKLPGVYPATLRVAYAATEITDVKEFEVGIPRIELTRASYEDETGNIKPIDVEGDLRWNRPLQATIEIFADDEPVFSEERELEGGFSERLYLDTERIATPTEEIRIVVTAKGATDELTISVTEAVAKERSYLWLAILAVTLAVILALLLLRSRRR